MVRELKNCTMSSVFSAVVDSRKNSNPIVNQARKVITNALHSDDLKLALDGLRTLRQLEDNHIKVVQHNEKLRLQTVESDDFLSIEDVVKRVNDFS